MWCSGRNGDAWNSACLSKGGGGAMTNAFVEVVVVLVVGNSGVVVRTSDYLFDTCCLLRLL